MKMGFKPALVCADTFAIDAFDLLKKASKDEVPVYRRRLAVIQYKKLIFSHYYYLYCFDSSCKRDPARIASEGIAKFRKDSRDFIVVDTTGRHTEFYALFVEMRRLANAVVCSRALFLFCRLF